MPRNVASVIENNFVNGLITEATALNFPEAAFSEGYNVVPWAKGNITRRKGFDHETSFVYSLYKDRTASVINTYLWQNAAGNGDYSFVVLQIGNTISFYRVSPTGALSANLAPYTFYIDSLRAPGAPLTSTIECQFATGQGYLFVSHPYCLTFYVSFNPDDGSLTPTAITQKIRDFEGLDDATATDSRLASLGLNHTYNLYNQGWSSGQIAQFQVSQSVYPSDADVWWLFKDASEVFTPSLATTILRGNSPAPKGHFILDAFYQDRSGVSGASGVPVVSSGYQRPSTVAFFASRVWYAGVQAQGFSNKLYFSQIIENPRQFGLCHQVNDPSSEFQFDLLATDGGQINILECGSIIKLFSTQSSLIIFATNGVWSLSGSTGTGFTASDFTVRRISTVPALSGSSFVDVGGAPMWWNQDGVYTISAGDALGNVSVVSVSEKKIKSFYGDIPNTTKRFAKGFYNSLTKVVQWAYKQEVEADFADAYNFDRLLCLNTITGAFYVHSFTNETVKLNGLVSIQGNGSDDEDTALLASNFKYLISVNGSFTWAEEYDDTYQDWGSTDYGEDYSSYFISGYKVHGDAQKRFQANYIYVYANNEEPATFYIQGIWDYATSPDTGDFTSRQKLVFYDDGRAYSHRRLKIRGSGLAVQFKFISQAGEPFDITGWSVMESGNATV